MRENRVVREPGEAHVPGRLPAGRATVAGRAPVVHAQATVDFRKNSSSRRITRLGSAAMPEISRRSVLTVLGAGALGAAGTGATLRTATGSTPPEPAASGPDNPTRAENRLPGSGDWRI